jgi:hypothetical protein
MRCRMCETYLTERVSDLYVFSICTRGSAPQTRVCQTRLRLPSPAALDRGTRDADGILCIISPTPQININYKMPDWDQKCTYRIPRVPTQPNNQNHATRPPPARHLLVSFIAHMLTRRRRRSATGPRPGPPSRPSVSQLECSRGPTTTSLTPSQSLTPQVIFC